MKIYKCFIIASISFWLSVNIYCCNNSKIIINELNLCTTILDISIQSNFTQSFTMNSVCWWIAHTFKHTSYECFIPCFLKCNRPLTSSFLTKRNTFIQQGWIKLIKISLKTVMLQWISISNSCCSFELSIHQRILKKCIRVYNNKAQ